MAANFAAPANRGGRLRAVGRTVRFDLMTLRLGRPTVARLGKSSKIIAYPGETNSPLAVYRNPPNWPEMWIWQQRLGPGDLFVDVGANIGVYSLIALERGAETIAVEPNPRSAARIREHLALNGYEAALVEKALADAPGTRHMTEDLDSLNHLLPPEESRGLEVEVTTLDALLGDRIASGVKIDVEGAELLVLQGAERALREHRIRMLQLEWLTGDWMLDAGGREPVADLLAAHGYEIFAPDSRGVLQPYRGQPLISVNVFALPVQPRHSSV